MIEADLRQNTPQRRAIVVDVDGTLCPIKGADERYSDLVPYAAMIAALKRYRADGWQIVLYTSRNMNTFAGNLGRINVETAPVLLDWLRRWDIPYDEIHFGKPWPGRSGFYVEDRAVRPDEFLRHTKEEIEAMIERGRELLGAG